MNWVYELPFGRGRALRQQRRRLMDRADRRLGVRRRRPRPERLIARLRQRAPGRHDATRICRTSTRSSCASTRQAASSCLHPAAGHHRQHDQGVQHQRDVGHRLRRARRADAAATSRRPTDRTASRRHGRRRLRRRASTGRHRADGSCASISARSSASRFVGHTNFEFRAEMLNAFNNINFTPVAGKQQHRVFERDDRAGDRCAARRQ